MMATTRSHARPRTRSAFRIAIICALKVEADAVLEVLDPESTSWDSLGKAESDNNTYTTGSINRHNVVVLFSGAGIPKTSAAAGHLFRSFPNISLVLVVGVCGGVPAASDKRDIFLGDLVISSDAVHYTSGKQYPTGSARITRRDDELGKQQPEARNFVRKFELSTYQKKLQHGIQTELIKYHAINPEAFPLYPGISHDTLFASDFQHKHRSTGACENGVCSTDGASICLLARKSTCSELECGSDKGAYVRFRESVSEESPAPSVHVGTFGTGDTVMKSGIDRDLIASKDGINAFEMESAGVWDQRPTVVLKSVCDYADSHKSDEWHSYAAGVAALGLKVLLQYKEKELPGVDLAADSREALPLKDALAYPRRDAKLELIREDRIPLNSFDWVWSKTTWKSWLSALGSEEAQFFWISGLPGSGKSTLMESLAVDKRTMKFLKKANQSCKILRFFFDFRAGKDTANNRLGLLKLVISELWQTYDANTPEGGKLEDRHARDPVDEMSEGRLVDLLSEVVDAIPQRLLVFVDGLDEYEGDAQGLVDFLLNLRRRTSMHLCLASRPERIFEIAFRDCSQFAMQDHNEASVRMYIDYAIEAASSRLIDSRTIINSDIRESIVSKAQGVIIWARLAVNELLREDRVDTTPNALRKVIDTLPEKLESLYQQTLSRLPSANAPEAALILLIIMELGHNGRIDDELLYGYFRFVSDRCSDVSQDPQTISDQSEANRLHLYRMKSRTRTRCGALINISLQRPELYAEGSWSQTDDGDLVTFNRSFWHPLSREPQYNPRWYATLFHRTFHEYLDNNKAILHSQIPRTLLFQYPDAFRSRIYANVIAAATEDGYWDLQANFSAVTEAIDEVDKKWDISGLLLYDSLKTLFDDVFITKLSPWKPGYAIIVDSMRWMPVAASAEETYISKPYETWKQALASPILFIIVRDDMDAFLSRSVAERVLRLAVKWCLPRLFSEAYTEITTSQDLVMPVNKWHELFSFAWKECFVTRPRTLPRDVADSIKDMVSHKRRLQSYDGIFRSIIPHLVYFDYVDLAPLIKTFRQNGERSTDDSVLEADMVYRVLYSTRELPWSNPSLTYPNDFNLPVELRDCTTLWVRRRRVRRKQDELLEAGAERPYSTVKVLDERASLYPSTLCPAERLCLGSELLLLRFFSNNVALLSVMHSSGEDTWNVFQQALADIVFPPTPRRGELQHRDQIARASLVLFLVFVVLRVEPGDWDEYARFTSSRWGPNRLTEVQSKVTDIILFAIDFREKSGHWPDYETMTSRKSWKKELDEALGDPLVRVIDDDGNIALQTLIKYHQGLINDGIIDAE